MVRKIEKKSQKDLEEQVIENAYKKERQLTNFGRKTSPAERQNLSREFERTGSFLVKNAKAIPEEERIAQAAECYRKAMIYTDYPSVKKRLGEIKDELDEKELQYRRGFILHPFAILSITSLLAALSFVSLSLTGNVVAGLEQNDSRWMGLCFFICGLVFSFIYLKSKKK